MNANALRSKSGLASLKGKSLPLKNKSLTVWIKSLASRAARKCPPLDRQIRRWNGIRLHEPTLRLAHQTLGTEYGGWAIPTLFLHQDSIVYAVGVGEDISFDLALVELYGCKLFAFDPTPVALEFIRGIELPDQMCFIPIGLSAEDGWAKFFAPQVKGFASYSQTMECIHGDVEEISCQVLSLHSIMKKLQHSRVDLLKMDIEGFEYDVIQEFISSETLPTCLLVEFHHLLYGISPERTRAAVEMLTSCGYGIYWISPTGREYGFLRNS